MKALVVTAEGVELLDRPDPEPPPDGVVVSVHSCGICGSDVHSVAVGSRRRGQILGHELSGRIAEVGRSVRGWRHGQAVAVNPLGGCGSCGVCRQGLPFLCDRLPNLGLTAPGGLRLRTLGCQTLCHCGALLGALRHSSNTHGVSCKGAGGQPAVRVTRRNRRT